MKRILMTLLFFSALANTGISMATGEPGVTTNAFSNLDVLFNVGQSAAPKEGVAVFMARGISYMTMTVVGHEAPCDFTLFNQAREFSRFQMVNHEPFRYCVLGRTNHGTLVKVAIAGSDKKSPADSYVIGTQTGGDMAPAYWDASSRMLVLAGYSVSGLSGSVKETPAGAAAKALVCGVTIAELSGARPDISVQRDTCTDLRVMYYALRQLRQAEVDLKEDKPDSAGKKFREVIAWLTSNKVESMELVEAKLGEGAVQDARKDYAASARSYVEANNLLKSIDPTWDDMRLVIGWRLAKAFAQSKQFEAGMRGMVRLNHAPSSCGAQCKEELIDTLDRYLTWAKRRGLAAGERLLTARKLVLKSEDGSGE